jgi:hypothetical protein
MRVLVSATLAAAALIALGVGPAHAGPPYVPPPPPPGSDPEPAPAPAPEEEPAPDDSATDAAPADAPRDESTTKEEEVDFEEEEKASDQQSQKIKAAAGSGGAGDASNPTSTGFKLFVDLLAIGKLGQETFAVRPNHTYVFLMAQVSEQLQFILHISDNPIFFELQWDPLPGLSLKVGKLLVPFGTNQFHHLIGGRVDEQSLFLPETWGDFGVAVNHTPLDTEWFGFEYTLYALNGFQGTDVPNVAAGTGVDNNYFKALGARTQLTLFSDYILTGSAYFDIWDPDQKYKTLFYALGVEMRKGFIPVPILDRLRLRGEWGRGEIELPKRNLQKGVIGDYATARTGLYGEATVLIWETLSGRVRTGRVNSDNTITTSPEEDLWLVEPAIIWWLAHNKVQLTLAYQMLLPAQREITTYDPFDPGDVVYGKIFLQF